MKFIKPSVEYWQQEAGLQGVWKQIAHATRVCYQSQQRSNETDEEFVKRVILKPALITRKVVEPNSNSNGTIYNEYNFDKMHGAMLEHGTVYLRMSPRKIMGLNIIEKIYNNNKYSIVNNVDDILYITTNMRVICELDRWQDLKFLCEPTEHHSKRYTFNVITDIGVTREGNRHRKNSVEEDDFSTAEESTRYNAYDKGKYGNELTYVKPAWYNKDNSLFEGEYAKQNDGFKTLFLDLVNDINGGSYEDWYSIHYYAFGLLAAEFAYMGMRKCGERAEHCRQVLNLNTKTQVVWTAFASDWQHFLKLRSSQAVSGKPHENMVVVADKIAQIAKEQNLW